MKTAIIVTQWLGTEEYYKKSIKFYEYYGQKEVMDALGLLPGDIWVVDNASESLELDALKSSLKARYEESLRYKVYEKHYSRTAHLEYPYCWRALYFARELFQEYDYEKVIYMNNDSYIISEKMMEAVKNIETGYYTPYCKKHNFPECEIQIICKDSVQYWELTGRPYLRYNGQQMEDVIPSLIMHDQVGDRHSEDGLIVQDPSWDFSTQVRLETVITMRKK